jgi:hypothetical protein
MSPTPTSGDFPDRLTTLLRLPRTEAKGHASIDASVFGGTRTAMWAGYALHLIDVIEGYEKAIANLDRPASNGTETSDEAARILAPGVGGRRAIILRQLLDRRAFLVSIGSTDPAQEGMTCKDLEAMLGWSHGTASARLHELAKLCYVAPTGHKRTTSIGPGGTEFKGQVFDITKLGIDQLNQHEGT